VTGDGVAMYGEAIYWSRVSDPCTPA